MPKDIGAFGWTRTPNHVIHSPVMYLLNHVPSDLDYVTSTLSAMLIFCIDYSANFLVINGTM